MTIFLASRAWRSASGNGATFGLRRRRRQGRRRRRRHGRIALRRIGCVIGRQLAGIDLGHGMDVAAHVVDRVHPALVAEVARQMAVLPQHEDGPLARFLGLADPGDATRREIRRSLAHEPDVAAVFHRQHHLRVRVVLRPGPALGADALLEPRQRQLRRCRVGHLEHADVHRLGRLGSVVDGGLLLGRQRRRIRLAARQDVIPVLAQPGDLAPDPLQPLLEPRRSSFRDRHDLGTRSLELLGLGLPEEAQEELVYAGSLLRRLLDDHLLAAGIVPGTGRLSQRRPLHAKRKPGCSYDRQRSSGCHTHGALRG